MTARNAYYKKELPRHRTLARTTHRGWGIAGCLGGPFWVLVMVYIYHVNHAVVDTLAIKDGEKRMAVLEQEVTKMETGLMTIAVGGNLEARAKELGLEAPETPRFLTGDTIVARLGE